MDGPNVDGKFSNKFEKTKETNLKTDVANTGSCSFDKLCNAFLKKKGLVLWIADCFAKLYLNCITKRP